MDQNSEPNVTKVLGGIGGGVAGAGTGAAAATAIFTVAAPLALPLALPLIAVGGAVLPLATALGAKLGYENPVGGFLSLIGAVAGIPITGKDNG